MNKELKLEATLLRVAALVEAAYHEGREDNGHDWTWDTSETKKALEKLL